MLKAAFSTGSQKAPAALKGLMKYLRVMMNMISQLRCLQLLQLHEFQLLASTEPQSSLTWIMQKPTEVLCPL